MSVTKQMSLGAVSSQTDSCNAVEQTDSETIGGQTNSCNVVKQTSSGTAGIHQIL